MATRVVKREWKDTPAGEIQKDIGYGFFFGASLQYTISLIGDMVFTATRCDGAPLNPSAPVSLLQEGIFVSPVVGYLPRFTNARFLFFSDSYKKRVDNAPIYNNCAKLEFTGTVKTYDLNRKDSEFMRMLGEYDIKEYSDDIKAALLYAVDIHVVCNSALHEMNGDTLVEPTQVYAIARDSKTRAYRVAKFNIVAVEPGLRNLFTGSLFRHETVHIRFEGVTVQSYD
jgi:hypothetical protein